MDLSRFKRSSSSYQHDLEGSYERIKQLEKVCTERGHSLIETGENLKLDCDSLRLARSSYNLLEFYKGKVSQLETLASLQNEEIENLRTLYELAGGTLD